MAYISSVGTTSYRIELGSEDHEQTITLNGTSYSVDWRQIAPLAGTQPGLAGMGGRGSLLIGGRSFEVFVRRLQDPEHEGGYTYEVLLAGQRFEVRVEDEREKTLAGAAAVHESGEALVRAPMPGLVLALPVEPGTKVVRGETVVVLEAMKMENDLAAPRHGTVKEIRVSKGQTVNQGAVLVVIVAD